MSDIFDNNPEYLKNILNLKQLKSLVISWNKYLDTLKISSQGLSHAKVEEKIPQMFNWRRVVSKSSGGVEEVKVQFQSRLDPRFTYETSPIKVKAKRSRAISLKVGIDRRETTTDFLSRMKNLSGKPMFLREPPRDVLDKIGIETQTEPFFFRQEIPDEPPDVLTELKPVRKAPPIPKQETDYDTEEGGDPFDDDEEETDDEEVYHEDISQHFLQMDKVLPIDVIEKIRQSEVDDDIPISTILSHKSNVAEFKHQTYYWIKGKEEYGDYVYDTETHALNDKFRLLQLRGSQTRDVIRIGKKHSVEYVEERLRRLYHTAKRVDSGLGLRIQLGLEEGHENREGLFAWNRTAPFMFFLGLLSFMNGSRFIQFKDTPKRTYGANTHHEVLINEPYKQMRGQVQFYHYSQKEVDKWSLFRWLAEYSLQADDKIFMNFFYYKKHLIKNIFKNIPLWKDDNIYTELMEGHHFWNLDIWRFNEVLDEKSQGVAQELLRMCGFDNDDHFHNNTLTRLHSGNGGTKAVFDLNSFNLASYPKVIREEIEELGVPVDYALEWYRKVEGTTIMEDRLILSPKQKSIIDEDEELKLRLTETQFELLNDEVDLERFKMVRDKVIKMYNDDIDIKEGRVYKVRPFGEEEVWDRYSGNIYCIRGYNPLYQFASEEQAIQFAYNTTTLYLPKPKRIIYSRCGYGLSDEEMKSNTILDITFFRNNSRNKSFLLNLMMNKNISKPYRLNSQVVSKLAKKGFNWNRKQKSNIISNFNNFKKFKTPRGYEYNSNMELKSKNIKHQFKTALEIFKIYGRKGNSKGYYWKAVNKAEIYPEHTEYKTPTDFKKFKIWTPLFQETFEKYKDEELLEEYRTTRKEIIDVVRHSRDEWEAWSRQTRRIIINRLKYEDYELIA